MEIDELLRRQDQLQAEAATVRQDLGLDQRLSTLGEVVPVGSAALGLMVWRDLDLTVVCRRLDAEAVAGAGALLAGHPRVPKVRFIDDTGEWNTDPTYPDGLYLGLRCRSLAGEIWKVDIWFVDDPDRQPDLAHARDLPKRLTAETRAAILGVKDAWAGRPEYRREVRSWDIYARIDAVIRDEDDGQLLRLDLKDPTIRAALDKVTGQSELLDLFRSHGGHYGG